MWHYDNTGRSVNQEPGPIPQLLVREDVFVFLGKLRPSNRIDYEVVLSDFDRLLPLYGFVEGSDESQPGTVPSDRFVFCPGFSIKASSAIATQDRKERDIDFIHNKLQEALCRRLVPQQA